MIGLLRAEVVMPRNKRRSAADMGPDNSDHHCSKRQRNTSTRYCINILFNQTKFYCNNYKGIRSNGVKRKLDCFACYELACIK